MRVLAVDDDQTILDLVQQILSLTGRHQVVVAPSAKDALRAIEEAHDDFDCVLVDIQMPEIDGIFLVRLIRQTPGYKDVPIVMLTAMEERRYLTQAFSAGATDYITKPFEFQDLRSRLLAARKLAIEKVRQRVEPLMAGEMKGMGTELKDFRLSQPIPLGNLKGAIEYGEFENYVRQLARRRLFNVSAFAVKMGSVDKIYAEHSSADFRKIVLNAAQVVQEALLHGEGVLSYRGNGVFLCIPEARIDDSWQVMQTAVNDQFHATNGQSERSSVQLRVGDKVQFTSNSIVRMLETLSAAVASAESRSHEFGDFPKAPRRFWATFGQTNEEQHLEKRAYEALLRNAMTETTDHVWRSRLERREKKASGCS